MKKLLLYSFGITTLLVSCSSETTETTRKNSPVEDTLSVTAAADTNTPQIIEASEPEFSPFTSWRNDEVDHQSFDFEAVFEKCLAPTFEFEYSEVGGGDFSIHLKADSTLEYNLLYQSASFADFPDLENESFLRLLDQESPFSYQSGFEYKYAYYNEDHGGMTFVARGDSGKTNQVWMVYSGSNKLVYCRKVAEYSWLNDSSKVVSSTHQLIGEEISDTDINGHDFMQEEAFVEKRYVHDSLVKIKEVWFDSDNQLVFEDFVGTMISYSEDLVATVVNDQNDTLFTKFAYYWESNSLDRLMNRRLHYLYVPFPDGPAYTEKSVSL